MRPPNTPLTRIDVPVTLISEEEFAFVAVAISTPTVRIACPNNSKIEINIDHVYGHPKAPLSEKEYLEKFSKCCFSSTNKVDQNQVNRMLDFIFDLENKDNVIDFFKAI